MQDNIKTRPIHIVGQDKFDQLLFGKKKVNLGKTVPSGKTSFTVPESKPFLQSYIYKTEWSILTKKIQIWIGETPKITAQQWIHSLMSKPDNITVVLYDINQNKIGAIEFDDLQLEFHKCTTDQDGDYVHEIICSFEKFQVFDENQEYEESVFEEEALDQWCKETPVDSTLKWDKKDLEMQMEETFLSID